MPDCKYVWVGDEWEETDSIIPFSNNHWLRSRLKSPVRIFAIFRATLFEDIQMSRYGEGTNFFLENWLSKPCYFGFLKMDMLNWKSEDFLFKRIKCTLVVSAVEGCVREATALGMSVFGPLCPKNLIMAICQNLIQYQIRRLFMCPFSSCVDHLLSSAERISSFGKRGKAICNICGKVCTQNALRRHQITHVNVRPHHCSICGKGFQRSDNCKVHERSHTHRGFYKCGFCGKGYSRSNIKRAHEKVCQGQGAVKLWLRMAGP